MFHARASTPYEYEERPRRKPYSRPARTCQVSSTWYELHDGRGRYEAVPYLKLRGRWLRDNGFEIGAKVDIEVKEGMITLTVIETPAPVAPKVPRKVQQELSRAGSMS